MKGKEGKKVEGKGKNQKRKENSMKKNSEIEERKKSIEK